MTWLKRYQEILDSWEGTPYSDATCKKGRGTNCLRFAVAVLDELHGYNPKNLPPVPRMPIQTAVHNPAKALEVVRFVARRYPNDIVLTTNEEAMSFSLQPADVVIVQRTEDHPEHILLAAPRQNVLYHSFNTLGADGYGGVTSTGWGWCIQRGIYRVYRPKAAATWT